MCAIRTRLVLTIAIAWFCATACSADPTPVASPVASNPPRAEPPSAQAQTAQATAEPLRMVGQVSHHDVAQARAVLELARERWVEAGPHNYVMTISESCECDGWTAEFVVVDSALVTRVVRPDSPGLPPEGLATMEQVFSRASSMIGRLEDDPSLLPESGCDGAPFSVDFDTETGAVTFASNNTPCDGGASWGVQLDEISREGHDPVPVDLSDWQNTITPAALLDPATAITTESWVPGLVIQVETQFNRTDDEPEPERRVIGDPCEFDDADTCWDQIESLLQESPPLATRPCDNCPTETVHVVSGRANGGPEAVTSGYDFSRLVGGVDSAPEAVLAAGRFGLVSPSDEGWLVASHEVIESCDPIVARHSVQRIDPERGFSFETERWFSLEWGVCN